MSVSQCQCQWSHQSQCAPRPGPCTHSGRAAGCRFAVLPATSSAAPRACLAVQLPSQKNRRSSQLAQLPQRRLQSILQVGRLLCTLCTLQTHFLLRLSRPARPARPARPVQPAQPAALAPAASAALPHAHAALLVAASQVTAQPSIGDHIPNTQPLGLPTGTWGVLPFHVAVALPCPATWLRGQLWA
jgi:hypothetical protein